MDWLAAPDYWLTRFVFERALGAVYLVAFLVTVNQFRPLLGERGLLPAPEFIRAVPFRASPTLFHLFGYSDRRLLIVAWTGVALSIVATLGLLDEVWFSVPFASMVIFAALWVLYLSIVNIGQTFYSFGWESLLLETGFLAIFLGPATTTPQFSLIVLLRWLLFRVEFGAGLIKMRGDRCWRDLTCLYYHHETQPMSNPLSWYFHHLPKRLHRIEVLGNHFAQLVVPWFLFFPQPIASLAGLVIILTQSWLLLSGNFAWLNVITITLAVSAFDNAALGLIFPLSPQEAQDAPGWYLGIVLAVTALIVFLSYRPARNLLSRRQIMNASFDPFHIVGTYGAFGSVTKERFEIVIEGTAEPDLTPRRSGASTSSRENRATSGAGRRKSRRTTSASTGSCGSRRCHHPCTTSGSYRFSGSSWKAIARPSGCCEGTRSMAIRRASFARCSTCTALRRRWNAARATHGGTATLSATMCRRSASAAAARRTRGFVDHSCGARTRSPQDVPSRRRPSHASADEKRPEAADRSSSRAESW